MCNFFVKISSAFVLVAAIIFNFFGNLFGVGDIIPTDPETTETTLTEFTTLPEESTTEPVTVPSTEESTTAKVETTYTTAAPTKPQTTVTKPSTVPSTAGTTTPKTTKPQTTVEYGPKVDEAKLESFADFGGMNTDTFTSARAVSKGGFVACGVSNSTDGVFSGVASNWGNTYGYVAMFDKDAKLVWIKALGSGEANVRIEDVAVLSDGSVVAVGYTKAPDIGYSPAHEGSIDSFVVKYSADGSLLWIKCYGGSSTDMLMAIAPLGSGFVAGGKTDSTDKTFADSIEATTSKAVLMSLDADGNIIWKRYLAGNYGSAVDSIDTDSNGNIFFASVTAASTGDFAIEGMGKGYLDTAVFKYNQAGERLWGAAVASSGRDNFGAIVADGEGGCVVAGNYELVTTYLPDGTFASLHNCGGIDAVVIRFNSNGTMRWMRSVAGFADDFINDITKTANGGFAVAGYTTSSNRDFAKVGNKGQNDAFTALITPAGNLADVKSLGGARKDAATNVVYTTNGKLVMLGQTTSADGDFDGVNAHLTDEIIDKFGDLGEMYTGFIAKYGVTISI